MCGILCHYRPKPCEVSCYSDVFEKLIPCISDRGPDLQQALKFNTGGENGGTLHLFSSVLSLRPPLTEQPVHYKETNDVLQFNGELYNDDIAANDTSYFYGKLLKTKSKEGGIVSVIQDLRGEYAFTYYDYESNSLWFGRDCVGRRSLMYSWNSETGELIIASVADTGDQSDTGMEEVPGGVIFCLKMDSNSLIKIPWESPNVKDAKLTFPYGAVSSLYKLQRSKESADAYTEQLMKLMSNATRRRIEGIPLLPLLGSSTSRLAILFSGGIDCTLLASFADEILPKDEKIDLLNVAFDNPRIGGGYSTPDRKLGRRSWKELADLHRTRYQIPVTEASRFRFVEVNVPYQETLENRPKVQRLIRPHESVMDLSIAIAFYFASRGKGSMYEHEDDDNHNPDYTSHSRVLLSGLGADELFGGYSRHAREFSERGPEAFAGEMQLDFGRLHARNLGRDDRACATWGKELRYPYLDEDVIAWTMECPLDLKMKAAALEVNEKDVESKYILRQIARELGLEQVALEKKRAIQFGAKSAKMELGSGKVKGTEIFQGKLK